MKKILLILAIMLFNTSIINAEDNKQEFKNYLFYQQLIDTTDESMYIITPTSKFFDPSIPDYYTEAKCNLLDNEENFIKMLCNDCINLHCNKHQERLNTFEILSYDKTSNKYYIKHKIIDKNNNKILRENILSLDNIIAIHPHE